ncbi:MAG: ATP-binding protein [Planctomycetes bacterium]|nr:ATP-binding protein [Planctomycetota bacterium]
MVSMKDRSLAQPIGQLALSDHKIAFVSGPRQCGKTTLAKMLLRSRKVGLYRNWDEIGFRRAWARNPSALIPRAEEDDVPLVVLDEIHKDRRWKRNLKGVFDTLEAPCDILVTGSARLRVYMRGSDSLLGRHLSFRLHPFSVREVGRPDVLGPDEALNALFARARTSGKATEDSLAALMTYGPFPEPLLAQDTRKARLWRRNREQLVVREDLRDLSRLPDLGRIEMMTALMPERVGSLFSLSSLARDLEVSVPTIKRWMAYLDQLYYVFEIKPYTRRIARSLRREGKVYLWDYAAVRGEAQRFENLVAAHLLKACHYWTDTGEGDFALFYLRTKEKQEIDFLIVRDGKPWLPVEVKHAESAPAASWARFAPILPCTRGLQLVRQPHWETHRFGAAQVLVAGAAEALGYFA